jgi:hypothetical protein
MPGLAVIVALLATAASVYAWPATPSEDCKPPPDPIATLAAAWQAYQPDQPLSWTVNVRRRLFALQALLLSAGMYGEPPLPPTTAYERYAPLFVRDLGASRNEGLALALTTLATKLEASRDAPDADLADNCGLLLARRELRDDRVSIATDWVVQAATNGFAPYFQASVQQLVRDHALACSADVDNPPETVLTCTLQRVGFHLDADLSARVSS